MYFTAKTLDDLMHQVLERLLHSRNRVAGTRGATRELNGVLLKIANPRARLSRSVSRGKVFSGLGELLWYLSGRNDLKFIEYYLPGYGKDNSDDGKTIYGAYGPRLFKMRGEIDQIENVVRTLEEKPDSRRAVIQLFNAEDLVERVPRRKEIPCTCTMQFMVRRKRLEMFATMRSNDVVLGLTHDVFTFTMLQEIIARRLGVEVGSYKHAVGSLHLYEDDFPKAQKYVDEGYQSTIPMPPMPIGDPRPEIRKLLRFEARIREGKTVSKMDLMHPGYWADLLRLLQVFKYSKRKDGEAVAQIKRWMTSKVFNTYIQRRELDRPAPAKPEQMDIPFPAEPTPPPGK